MMKRIISLSLLAFLILGAQTVLAESRYYDPNETATLAVAPGSGRTFYIDGTNGNDSYNGLYPTYQGESNGPYKTISQALYRYYDKDPGDRILIRAGIYYERIRVPDIYAYDGPFTADNPFVVMHEFGHSFGDLADEYVDDYYLSFSFKGDNYPNCDSSSCDKWAETEGTGCFKGCSTDGFYRGTKNSLMKSLSAKYFGPINKEVLKEKLDVYER